MIESSPDDFVQRYGAYAAAGELYPQPEGSPLLEFASGGRVLYLFDRCGPYAAPPGPARVLVHAALSDWAPCPPPPPGTPDSACEVLIMPSISALEGLGRVTARPASGHPASLMVALHARLPLLLSGPAELRDVAAGDWLRFTTEAPLHGFVLTGAALTGGVRSPMVGRPVDNE